MITLNTVIIDRIAAKINQLSTFQHCSFFLLCKESSQWSAIFLALFSSILKVRNFSFFSSMSFYSKKKKTILKPFNCEKGFVRSTFLFYDLTFVSLYATYEIVCLPWSEMLLCCDSTNRVSSCCSSFSILYVLRLNLSMWECLFEFLGF